MNYFYFSPKFVFFHFYSASPHHHHEKASCGPVTIFENKLFIVSMVSGSVFKVSLFSLTLILSLMCDLSENKGFTDFQNTETATNTEAATRCVLCKKVFLEISQNSQENTYARVSFLIKLQASCTFCKSSSVASNQVI